MVGIMARTRRIKYWIIREVPVIDDPRLSRGSTELDQDCRWGRLGSEWVGDLSEPGWSVEARGSPQRSPNDSATGGMDSVDPTYKAERGTLTLGVNAYAILSESCARSDNPCRKCQLADMCHMGSY